MENRGVAAVILELRLLGNRGSVQRASAGKVMARQCTLAIRRQATAPGCDKAGRRPFGTSRGSASFATYVRRGEKFGREFAEGSGEVRVRRADQDRAVDTELRGCLNDA